MYRLLAIFAVCLVIGGCQTPKSQWQAAYIAAANHVSSMPQYSGYHRRENWGKVQVNICGPDVLKAAIIAHGGEYNGQAGLAYGANGQGEVWILGGPDWLDQWGLGHELGHILGYNVDHLIQGD